jgi:hypothetical protein
MTGWSFLPTNNPVALTQALTQTAAVVYVDSNSWAGYSSGVMGCTAGGVVNHAVVAVGYYNGVTVTSPTASTKMDYWVIRVSRPTWERMQAIECAVAVQSKTFVLAVQQESLSLLFSKAFGAYCLSKEHNFAAQDTSPILLCSCSAQR